MDKTQFLNEIKEFKTNAAIPSEVKDLIALYPYFMLAQLIQAKKESMHLFNLVVLFPDIQHLRNLFLEINRKENLLKNYTQIGENTLPLKEVNESNSEKVVDDTAQNDIIPCEDKENVSLDELIEKFNTNRPKISCAIGDSEEDQVYEDLCKSSVAEKMNIVSETLANIYKEQGNYDNAIKIYKALMTRYPEKSSTFANLITELKEKKNSQKN
ncbi:MAG: tetratricopeptide repeat protein [Bacteroidales bacterium]|jgi:tetratricopeptide (TPR) repeat protein|nr:tetratricopeptide repeat protein [Bacteroidales bacterium]